VSVNEKVVLVTDFTWASTEPEAVELTGVGGRLLLAEEGSEVELLRLVPEADAILTCFAQVTPAVVRAGKRLQVIGRYGVGVDNIAVEEATRRGILVTNVPSYCLDEVAEHALALILSLARRICAYNGAVRAGDWRLEVGAPIHRLSGQTVGIVGLGKIGRTLASKVSGLGMHVLASCSSRQARAEQDVEVVSLERLAREADVVSLHVPLGDETRGMIGEAFLRQMKPTAFLVNTARGALIDQDALLRALHEGWIAGAALDVFVPEKLPPEDPLLACPNLITTPHVAFYSEESVLELEVRAARNVAAVLSGRRPESIVNPEVLALDRWGHLR